MTAVLDTYAELRLAEGKLLRWGERDAKADIALQARDVGTSSRSRATGSSRQARSPSCGGKAVDYARCAAG